MGGNTTLPAEFIKQKDKVHVSKNSQTLRTASTTAALISDHTTQSLAEEYRMDLIQPEEKEALFQSETKLLPFFLERRSSILCHVTGEF